MANLAKRNKFQVAVLMIDIDRFKEFNDRYGHQAGDVVLRQTAQAIRSRLRINDIVGRYGGAEFLAFLSQVDRERVADLAEEVRLAVANAGEAPLAVTVSIGATTGLVEGDVREDIRALIHEADASLFKAKQSGRNRVVCSAS